MKTVAHMSRYWINQPSMLQSDHAFHGYSVIAPADLSLESGPCVTVYFVSGPVISARLFKQSLSQGWRN